MSMQSGEQIQPGTLIDERYLVQRLLGAGGMGTVILVRDTALKHAEVVLKFLHHRLAPDEQQYARFQNEVVLMRGMNHPNIVQTYDIGRLSTGNYYISMEYVAGCSLGDLLANSEDGRLSFDETLRILYEIALGLAHAHSKGVIHRDLKPDNVLISKDGRIKLTDFGLAKAIELDMSLTEPGETVGTPYYMAPEQFRGLKVDARADIYSFGLLAYELVVGSRPFQSDNFIDLAQQHFRRKIPSFAGRQSGIASWFQNFVEKCAAKSPEQRFRSCYEVLEVLSCFVDPKLVSPLPGEVANRDNSLVRRWKLLWKLSLPRRIFWAAALILALAFVVSFFAVGRKEQSIRRIISPPVLRLEQALDVDLAPLRVLTSSNWSNYLSLRNPDAMMKAMLSGDPDAVELLLLAGANPNGLDEEGRPYIHRAMAMGTLDVVDLLVEHGADLTAEDDHGRSALILAAEKGSQQLVASIIRHTPPDVLQVDKKAKNGRTALLYGVQSGSIGVVSQIIDAGASLLVSDDYGSTPLMYAVRTGSLEMVDYLLKKLGARGLDNVDELGRSALLIAAEYGEPTIVAKLLSFSPDLLLTDFHGRTALMLAAGGGHTEVCSLLLRRESALLRAADDRGDTALEYAAPYPATRAYLQEKVSKL